MIGLSDPMALYSPDLAGSRFKSRLPSPVLWLEFSDEVNIPVPPESGMDLCPMYMTQISPPKPGADPGGGGRWVRRPHLGRRDPHLRRGFLRLKGRKKGHWCPLNGCSTLFKHNMAIQILKSCKFVYAYVKNSSSPSHIRSAIPWRPPPPCQKSWIRA